MYSTINDRQAVPESKITTGSTTNFEKFREQIEQMNKMRERDLQKGGHLGPASCPNCGYCPHCGRGGHHTYPSNPWITYTSDTLYR